MYLACFLLFLFIGERFLFFWNKDFEAKLFAIRHVFSFNIFVILIETFAIARLGRIRFSSSKRNKGARELFCNFSKAKMLYIHDLCICIYFINHQSIYPNQLSTKAYFIILFYKKSFCFPKCKKNLRFSFCVLIFRESIKNVFFYIKVVKSFHISLKLPIPLQGEKSFILFL